LLCGRRGVSSPNGLDSVGGILFYGSTAPPLERPPRPYTKELEIVGDNSDNGFSEGE